MHRRTQYASAFFSIAIVAGCADGPQPPWPEGAPEPPAPTSTTPRPESTVAQSQKANVRFKRSARLRNDYAQALELDPSELCVELGQYACTEDVHRVALGDASPYTQGVYEPATETGVTAPLIVERVALAACGQRVELDFTYASAAVIFKDLPVDGDGNLEDADSEHVQAAVTNLYRRFLLRNPRDEEQADFTAAYHDVETVTSTDAARQWAYASCFAVATSIEALFY